VLVLLVQVSFFLGDFGSRPVFPLIFSGVFGVDVLEEFGCTASRKATVVGRWALVDPNAGMAV